MAACAACCRHFLASPARRLRLLRLLLLDCTLTRHAPPQELGSWSPRTCGHSGSRATAPAASEQLGPGRERCSPQCDRSFYFCQQLTQTSERGEIKCSYGSYGAVSGEFGRCVHKRGQGEGHRRGFIR
ncbi:hypothetical protein FN846DRAFT_326011 [Sphaerosporella brunnea]|uniref:Chitin-binding type-2 domain-containing protein n=1 Tax=Sphaerosporella brunnea TaxID=1250544 RepID=A0A5J5EKQ6_9PEZI|nr:hypothetical protein FN846DRAFT_326011 [Sphaerosporella brunnea]